MKIAFSPCPNDTYLFYAWVHNKVVGPSVEPAYLDIETLNQELLRGTYPLSKGSIALWPSIHKEYTLLPVGAAVGHGCGPLLIARNKEIVINEKIRVAVPGEHTTAHLLLNYFYPSITEKIFCFYHEVEELIAQGKADAGVVIHETRFTYAQRGFSLLADLGEKWKKLHGLPIPLGGIFVKRSLSNKQEIVQTLRASLAYVQQHQQEALPYILNYSRDLSEQIVKEHIDLYINHETSQLSSQALEAIKILCQNSALSLEV